MTGHDNGCSAACISVRKGHVRPRTMDDVSPGGLQGTHSFKIVAQQKLSAGHGSQPQAPLPASAPPASQDIRSCSKPPASAAALSAALTAALSAALTAALAAA
ncbi:hypothetical protein HaLaN_26020, partial [Haematococcus lacustris]